jgi:hypothetical protein
MRDLIDIITEPCHTDTETEMRTKREGELCRSIMLSGKKYTDRSKVIMRLQIITCCEVNLHLPRSVYNRNSPTLIEEH